MGAKNSCDRDFGVVPPPFQYQTDSSFLTSVLTVLAANGAYCRIFPRASPAPTAKIRVRAACDRRQGVSHPAAWSLQRGERRHGARGSDANSQPKGEPAAEEPA